MHGCMKLFKKSVPIQNSIRRKTGFISPKALLCASLCRMSIPEAYRNAHNQEKRFIPALKDCSVKKWKTHQKCALTPAGKSKQLILFPANKTFKRTYAGLCSGIYIQITTLSLWVRLEVKFSIRMKQAMFQMFACWILPCFERAIEFLVWRLLVDFHLIISYYIYYTLEVQKNTEFYANLKLKSTGQGLGQRICLVLI